MPTTGLFLVVVAGWLAALGQAADLMPAAEQNMLVQKYCAVCHTDAVRNGGLSLEHFDAANAAPSLTAMMLSKLTGGVPLETTRRIDADASAAALVEKKVKSGAMGASGIPRPDNAIVTALIRALAAKSAGATQWTLDRTGLTASILRETSSAKNGEEVRAYRLLVSCNPAMQQGSLQLAWSPAAQIGSLTESLDGEGVVRYPVDGPPALAAIALAGNLPRQSLTVGELFAGDTIVFPFSVFPRREFEACFSNKLQASTRH